MPKHMKEFKNTHAMRDFTSWRKQELRKRQSKFW